MNKTMIYRLSLLFLVLMLDMGETVAQTCNQFGVNLAGAEFGAKPGKLGTDYIYPNSEELDYFKSKGMALVRLPFSWERIQQNLGGALDADELNRIKSFVEAAAERNMEVLFDVHNYCRYKIGDNLYEIGSATVTIDHFSDLWVRLADEFKGYDNIWGYGLMNEPHDLTEATWFDMAQAAIDGIRTKDLTTTIVVGGDSWSSAERWWSYSDVLKYLSDPSDNLIFEAHVYFDNDASGKYYHSYDAEGATPMTGVDRVEPFVSWLRENNFRGFIGEYGVPADDSRWLTTLDNFMSYLQDNHLSGAYWAAGPWWGDYPLSIEPNNGIDKPQMTIASKYAHRMCQQNVISNGGFESGYDSWQNLVLGSADATHSLEVTDVRSGDASLKVQVDVVGEHDWEIQTNSTFFTLNEGHEYTLIFSGKSPTASTAKIILQNTTYLQNEISFTDSWEEYEWTFVAQESELQLKIHFGAEGTFLFDDFDLQVYSREIPHNGECVEPGTEPSVQFTSLRDLADFPVGAAIETTQRQWVSDHYFFENSMRPDIARQHFDILSVENALKQGALQGEEGVFTFDDGDEVVQFAEANNMDVHGHVLVWHAALPDWMINYTGDYEQMMLTHIEKVLEHYKGKMLSWDVVNEAFTDGDGSDHRTDSPWYVNIGPSYIEKAFAKAAEIDPETDLYYNDYSLVWGGAKLDRVIEMVNDLKSKNIKIDGIGMQSHIGNVDPCTFRESMEKLAATGLKIRISELDITVKDVEDADELTDNMAAVQAERYRKFVALYREVIPPSQQAGIVLWGMTDHDSWLKADDWPLLWDVNYNPKPALQGFADGLSGAKGDYTGYELKKAEQSIKFEVDTSIPVVQQTINFNAASNSCLDIVYSSSNSGILSITGNVGTIHSSGTVTVTATQSGNEQFNPATPVERNIEITKSAQTIDFSLASEIEITEGTFSLSATTSAGLDVIFSSSNDGIVSISGAMATILATGTVEITATQAGNDLYHEANPVVRSLTIVKSAQTIAFDPPGTISISQGGFDLVATASSSLEVAFSSSDERIVSIEGTRAHIHDVGTVTITASQPGNERYEGTMEVREIVVSEEVLSVLSKETSKVRLYPNPVRNLLTLDWADKLPTELKIYTMEGKMKGLRITKRTASSIVLDVSDLERGVYFLSAGSGEMFRFIVKN